MNSKKIACAEWHHFGKIDDRLTLDFISRQCNLDLQKIDVETIPHPTASLQNIYQSIGTEYDKNRELVQKIIDAIDDEFLYLDLRKTVQQLRYLIDEIDSFLVESTDNQ